MRIVTRPDLDGIACAALLFEAETIDAPVLWVSPNDMQRGLIHIHPGDIIANLPFNPSCSLWFDHHYSNRIDRPFDGIFDLAPSAARLIYEYYHHQLAPKYEALVAAVDRVDSADLTLEEVKDPSQNPYLMLAMTIRSDDETQLPYWNHLAQLLRHDNIVSIMADPEVRPQCERIVEQNHHFEKLLKQYSQQRQHVVLTDFRPLGYFPEGNRFLIYTLYPEASVSVSVGFTNDTRKTVKLKVGHSIFNPTCRVNVGVMLGRFEGGGHRGAGSCRFEESKTEQYLSQIVEILQDNQDFED